MAALKRARRPAWIPPQSREPAAGGQHRGLWRCAFRRGVRERERNGEALGVSINGSRRDMDLRRRLAPRWGRRLRHPDALAAIRAPGLAGNDRRGPNLALLRERLPDRRTDRTAIRLR